LVLALGNPLRGDDGVGPAVLEAVRGSGVAPISAELWPAHEGDLIDALTAEPWEQVVVVDAAEWGAPPGRWTRLDGSGALAGSPPPGTHGVGLLHALEVAQALGRAPARLSILAVQPLSTGWVPGLSEPVARAVEELAAAVLNELAREDDWHDATKASDTCPPDALNLAS
jgi:hydrogenase maturation protease